MSLEYDVPALIDMMVGLLETPSPTGYHREAIAYCEEAFASLGIPGLSLSRTRKGALMLHWALTKAVILVRKTRLLDLA